jgi:hypothetical protein
VDRDGHPDLVAARSGAPNMLYLSGPRPAGGPAR